MVEHLRQAMPFGLQLTVEALETGHGFAAQHRQRCRRRRVRGLVGSLGRGDRHGGRRGLDPAGRARWPRPCRAPRSCSAGRPTATPTSTGPNERVLLDEFEKTTVAIADLFARLGAAS